jgi:hypothetical protein
MDGEKRIVLLILFLVTWKQQVAHFNDCGWVGNYAVMCYQGCSLRDEENREEFSTKEQAEEKVRNLKTDRNSSDIHLSEVKELNP